jgi:hypothetical protein
MTRSDSSVVQPHRDYILSQRLPISDDIAAEEAAGKLVAEGSRYAVEAFSVVVMVTEG